MLTEPPAIDMRVRSVSNGYVLRIAAAPATQPAKTCSIYRGAPTRVTRQLRCSQLDHGGGKWQHQWPGPQVSSSLPLKYLPGCMPTMPLLLLLLSKGMDVNLLTGQV